MRKLMSMLLIFLIIGAVAGGFYMVVGSRGSTTESTEYTELRLVSEGDLQDKKDLDIVNGHVYLSLDYVQREIDPDVYYDEEEETLIFTNDKNVRRYKLEELEGTVNDVAISLRSPVLLIDGEIMVPEEAFAYDYDIDFRYIEDDNLVLMDRTDREYIYGQITKNTTWIREESSKSSPIIRTLNKGDQVIVYADNNKWVKVRQLDGRAGWVEKKYVEYSLNFEDFHRIKEKEEVSQRNTPINLAWDYYGIKTEGTENVKNLVGVNTISPTWFSLNQDLTIADRSNPDYTAAYQNRGIEVWPMFDNNYDNELTHRALSSSKNREQIIRSIIDISIKNGYEGLNIDFENINVETREYFTQFIKELYPLCKEHDIVLSVDVVPRIYSDVTKEQYNRAKLAENSDYIMLMAYDQHWSSSPTAGSVAEYSWVEANANVLFRDIPMDKFILGVPLYTRIWFDNGESVSSQAVSMNVANEYINNNGLDMNWDSKIKQYVGSKQVDNNLVSIWLEDGRSLREKASLVSKYNFAGVASWRLGFETDDVWAAIKEGIDN